VTADVELRPGRPGEAAALSELALRSKAHWGYSVEFLEACRSELTVAEAQVPAVTVAVAADAIAGFSLLEGHDAGGELSMLFVDPPRIGHGIGGRLLAAALESARLRGYRHVDLDADPDAAPFYLRYGARRLGDVPSGSIPGRTLPRLRFVL
jgi:GNAT superfamily N-acetyltransferase